MKRAAQPAARAGSVALVGAGPGDPDLLTVKAVRLLGSAEVIVHDRLVSDAVLALAAPTALLEFVGKAAGNHGNAQAAINRRLVELARAGLRVVRLKGGDPFVFGRGGEEIAALRAHGIPYEVVPGITAALACAAYAGIPLTHRDAAQQVSFVTAHCARSIDALDWAALARGRHTLAFYMGVGYVARIKERLVAHGRDPRTPAAVVENGTTPRQRVINSTLATLAADVARERVQAPAMIFVGEVAAMAADLGWFTPLAPILDHVA